MKEDTFLEKLEEFNLKELIISPYYAMDENGDVRINEDEIREQMEIRIKELNEIANGEL